MPMNDILGAVFDFLVQQLGIDGSLIVRGWQNRAALPDDTDYTVLTLLTAKRHGTNVHDRDYEAGHGGIDETISMLTEYTVQVDFCGTDEQTVMNRATQLALIARDAVACDFFRSYGFLPLYSEDVRNMPFANEERQWEIRYIVTLHFDGWMRVTVSHDAFTSVDIRLEDVDAHHPITVEE